MGGKTKHVARTKNNVKPSSSARTAELLGAAAPTFVGFSMRADSLVPVAPGLASAEQLSDAFDAISPQTQILLRKLSKKDPMTKKKALQELLDLVEASDLDTLKAILPLWPKNYQNLANDIEHNVRELTQILLQRLMIKCKRNMAPYLKQLVPVWLASQYDNYAPAASVATNSFRDTFAGNVDRTQEVCLHCQTEILDYTIRNLTFHSATTLSIGKSLTPEEAEQKYHRVIISSLKELSFFVQHTAKAEQLDQLKQSLLTLQSNQKYWSLVKHKIAGIRAAWFEYNYHILESPRLLEVVSAQRDQLITTTFQNIDDGEPVVAPHVWGCILLLQKNYEDWYKPLSVRKALLPKLGSLMRNGFNHNAQAICPNLLPFLSKITQASLQDLDIYEFYRRFFDNIKASIIDEEQSISISKSECGLISNCYFECLRYLLQQINNSSERSDAMEEMAQELLENHLLEPIEWLLKKDNAHVKYFFQHSAALVAFWDRQCSSKTDEHCLYAQLLTKFWKKIFEVVTHNLKMQTVTEPVLANVLLLVQDLYVANPSLVTQTVKFIEPSDESVVQQTSTNTVKKEQNSSASFIQKELKQLVVKLVRTCLENAATELSNTERSRYVAQLRILTKMFTDASFYQSLSESDDIEITLNKFELLLALLNDEDCDSVVEIIFEILPLLEGTQRYKFITQMLLKKQRRVQNFVLQRLLSYPLCTESAVREVLSLSETSAIITNIAEEVAVDNSREKLNLLHKCFFQTDTGDILINSATVDKILIAMCKPLKQPPVGENVEVCGSFIAQIMPVICGSDNSSLAVRQQIFLTLYKYSLQYRPSDYLSEDTLWEITTCWQDALSSKDIEIDDELLENCASIVEDLTLTADSADSDLDAMADAMAKFIICSTENIEDETQRLNRIDKTILVLLTSTVNNAQDVHQFEQHCVYLDALRCNVSPGLPLDSAALEVTLVMPLLRRTALNFSTLCKLVCCVENVTQQQQQRNSAETEDELTEDYCDLNANLLKKWTEPVVAEILQCMYIATAAEALLDSSPKLNADCELLVLYISEKVRKFMSNSSDIVDLIKTRLLDGVLQETSVIRCRALTNLLYSQKYTAFEENASILLHEDLADKMIIQEGALNAYVMTLQYLLPKLSQKSLGLNSVIMRYDPPEIWIRAAVFNCLVLNNFETAINERTDKNIVLSILQFITTIAEQQAVQKDILLYNVDICRQSYESVLNTIEFMKLMIEVLHRFPYELTIKNWDAIRISLTSWVLSVGKSIQQHNDPKTMLFILNVYRLFATLMNFIRSEKQKSSTLMLKNVIDEWETLFARDVNVVLFKSFYELINNTQVTSNLSAGFQTLLEILTPTLELLDYSFIYAYCEASTSKMTLDHLCNFMLKQLYATQHCLRMSAVYALRQLTTHFVAYDIEFNDKQNDNMNTSSSYSPGLAKWHYLNRFETYLSRYDALIQKYLPQFTFKLSELEQLEPIDRHDALSYLLIWDCIIYACANSPVALRSVYTNWLNDNKFEENFLHFLFRAMPVDILKNHSAKVHSNGFNKQLSWLQLKDAELPLESYVCHLYTEVLRRLPAVVRKWWNTSQSRQKNFVDNLTTNYVSALICNEELKAISNRKEKHENMQVTVHTSTREVLAVYAIDEARMELVITLAPNYPLGAVKVECGKQIGGRASSRNVGMQLTIFLTHQNGTIYDGLTMWKNNLDKKFEGVEECYVCYTVIHQETCQLPKLTCKTCKKKFHGPCLYKWFTTSSKSTCPICRNVF